MFYRCGIGADEKRKKMAYLAAFAGMDAVVEAGSFVSANTAQDGVSIKF